jgi:hypothetical protein
MTRTGGARDARAERRRRIVAMFVLFAMLLAAAGTIISIMLL